MECPASGKMGLDNLKGRSKIPAISGNCPSCPAEGIQPGFMIPTPPSPQSTKREACKHPRVQIVAREEDAEFVECIECGDIFEASELKDIAIEDGTQPSES